MEFENLIAMIRLIIFGVFSYSYKHEVANDQEYCDDAGKSKKVYIAQWIYHSNSDIVKDFFRKKENIPAVPTGKSTQVDSDSPQGEHRSGKYPAHHPTYMILD
jgi:hypothetical protein